MSKQKAPKDALELNKQTLKDLPVDGSSVAGGAGTVGLKPGQDRMTIGTSGTSVIMPVTPGTGVIAPGH